MYRPLAVGRPPIAWGRLLPAVGTLLVVLAALSPFYGYERDELYFRMLSPAWGYIDQPPLTPLIVHAFASMSDTVWAIRIPAILLACGSVVVVTLITREVGGGRLAQTIAAWGYAFGTFTLVFGHSMLTGTPDLLVWPGVLLGAIRAVLRRDGRWWLLAGGVAGLGLSSKLLVAFLLAGIAVGLALAGPRREFRSPWLWAGVALVLLLGAPDLVYQLTHGLPQVRMGQALGAKHGLADRVLTLPYLAVLLSPLVVPVWVAGLVALFRRPEWRRIRFVAVAFLAVVLLAALSGGQVYYPYGALSAVFAIGCVPVAEWVRTRFRRAIVVVALVAGAVVNSLIALPIVPLDALGSTPIPMIDVATADQVGWPELAATVDHVGAAAGPGAIVLTSNYGEAGAIARYSSRFASRVWSGHNALGELPPPASEPERVVVVGYQIERVAPDFAGCRVAARLDDRVGVDNEEQGAPVTVCTGLRKPIAAVLRDARHLD